MKKLLASLAISALALAGCSDSTRSAQPSTPSPTASTTSGLRGEYNSVAELKDAAVGAGYTCEKWTDGDWNQGKCSEKDFFGVFSNPGSRSAHIHKAEAKGEPFTALVGDNWYISGDEAALKALEGKLKGKVEKLGVTATETGK